MVWIVAYLSFLVYPTISQRPAKVLEGGFFPWCLRLVSSADPPRNCSARRARFRLGVDLLSRAKWVGIAAGLWALLIAVSTLFTKQHYIADVIAGIFLACVTYVVFLHRCPCEDIPELDRRVAPVLMVALIGTYGVVVVAFWMFYRLHVK
jgi:hypothetical protein